MENKDLYYSLRYGSIIKLSSASNLLNDFIFFVEYIDEDKIVLINEDDEKIEIVLNDEGGLDDIDEIVILNHSDSGYATLNYLIPGKYIRIVFGDGTRIEGVIKKLEKDMITVECEKNTIIYIDFEYRGLIDKYNIKEIKVIQQLTQNKPINESSINNTNVYVPNEIDNGLIYDYEQQVEDYIQKNNLNAKNKSRIMQEINKYSLLLEEYTDSEQGDINIPIQSNQIIRSFMNLRYPIIIPVTSYANKDIYVEKDALGNLSFEPDNENVDPIEWNYSVKIKDDLEIFSEGHYHTSNIEFTNVKRLGNHKKVKLPLDSRVILINKSKDPLHNKPFFFYMKDGISNEIPYDTLNVDRGSTFIMDGVAFPSAVKLKKYQQEHVSSTLLSKSASQLHLDLEVHDKLRHLNDNRIARKSLFHPTKTTYYPLTDGDNSFRKYISRLNYRVNDFYHTLKEEVPNLYSCLTALGVLDIFKLSPHEFAFAKKYVQDSIRLFKTDLRIYHRKLKKHQSSERYSNPLSDSLHQIIVESYLIEDANRLQPSEILDESLLDTSNLLFSQLRMENKDLNIKFNDTEVSKYIDQVRDEINGTLDPKKINTINHAKVYENKQQMLNDSNKIILRNVLKTDEGLLETFDPLQELYKILLENTKFSGDMKTFIQNVELLLDGMYQDSENKTFKDTIFVGEDDNDIMINLLIKKIILMKVRKFEKCYIKDGREYYTYNGNTWIDHNKLEDDLDKKKILRTKKSMDDMLHLKKKMINDFVIDLVHRFERESDADDINYVDIIRTVKIQAIMIRNQRIRHSLKYNNQKLIYSTMFMQSSYESTITHSGATPLLYRILATSDLSKKYDLLQRFVSLFTIDIGDIGWYYCITTNTKLLPKYLIRLSYAYSFHDNHDKTMNEICQKEGYLSEDGDAWIHKESGFIIKLINFDNNGGYDDNGFQTKLEPIREKDLGLDLDLDNDISVPTIYDIGDKKIFKRLKMVEDTTLRIANILGVTLKPIDKTINVFEYIYQVYESSGKNANIITKIRKKSRRFIYSILTFILVHVQSNNIKLRSSFRKCRLSFEGYPLEDQSSSHGGITYLSCMIIELAGTLNSMGISHIESFKEANEVEIQDELIDFIKIHAIENDFIKNIIWDGRTRRDSAPIKDQIVRKSPLPARFKPQLSEIQLIDKDKLNDTSKDIYLEILLKKRKLNAINVNIEGIINNLIKKRMPILKTRFEEPFLVNFCCNSKDFILDHLPPTKDGRKQLSDLLIESREREEIINDLETKYTDGTVLRTSKIDNQIDDMVSQAPLYSRITIFMFVSKLFNFNNPKDIPGHLDDLNILKPDEEYYNRVMENDLSINEKIKILEEKGYSFDIETMMKIMKHHGIHVATKQQESVDKIRIPIQFASSIFERFQTDFMSTQDPAEQIDIFDSNIELLRADYINYIESFVKLSDRKIIKNQMDKWSQPKDTPDKELIIKQLYNINYALISTIPSVLIKKKVSGSDLITDQWKLASTHVEKIASNYLKYFEHFHLIDDDDYKESISTIGEYQNILTSSFFTKNIDSRYYFLLYLFYKLMNVYIKEIRNKKVSIDVNVGIINFIQAFAKVNSFTYENALLKNSQTKDAEKRQKTSMLRKLNPQQRELEKQKMVLKLGEWAYGTQKRVFKYYKELYDEDAERADTVKQIETEMYAENVTNGVIGDDNMDAGTSDYQTNISQVADDDGTIYGPEGNELELDDYG